MKKRVLLLAVSCKQGGLCPGGLDLDNPREWIRIVRNDGKAGAVQGIDIDFAEPLDVIEFDGTPMPMGKQRENWVINNNSCRNLGRKNGSEQEILNWAYQQYGYHDYWGNYKSYLNEQEFNAVTTPSESIMMVSDVRIYTSDFEKAKIDFQWGDSLYPFKWVSMTDQDYYGRIRNGGEVKMDRAIIVVSIPKDLDWVDSRTGERKAYKFVSRGKF